MATTIGVLASVVQFLGLVRWPFLVPYLARTAAEPDASEARREAVDVVFQSFNRYLGVGVGEHLGYLLTGAWSVLAGAALRQTVEVPSWLGVAGIVVGAVLMLCSLEFVARLRAHRLEARRRCRAVRLHRLVALADRHGRRAHRLRVTSYSAQGSSFQRGGRPRLHLADVA